MLPKEWTNLYLKELVLLKDLTKSEKMEAYMRNKFRFLGVQSADRKNLQASFWKEYEFKPVKNLDHLLLELFESPYREMHYFACDLAKKYAGKVPTINFELLEQLISSNSWWDTVDLLASQSVLKVYLEDTYKNKAIIRRWNRSKNIWLIRSSLIFQLKRKQNTEVDFLFEMIVPHLKNTEFFIAKAIGWVLREYSKTDPETVKYFIENNEMQNLSRREAIKYLK